MVDVQYVFLFVFLFEADLNVAFPFGLETWNVQRKKSFLSTTEMSAIVSFAVVCSYV